MARGISRQVIFRDVEDRLVFLEALSRVKEDAQLTIYGFALMDNHVHLLLREGNESLGTTMKRISVSYASALTGSMTVMATCFKVGSGASQLKTMPTS